MFSRFFIAFRPTFFACIKKQDGKLTGKLIATKINSNELQLFYYVQHSISSSVSILIKQFEISNKVTLDLISNN